LTAAIVTAVSIFVLLFTSLFTNLGGLATSTVATNGTLLYWLGQHDVRRGGQPWFYFITLMPQYELIALFFGFGAATAIAVRALGAAIGLWSPSQHLRFRGLLAVWAIGLFAGLSFAGEKMPWLLVHIALPACLLAGLLIGKLIERAIPLWRSGRIGYPERIIFIVLLIIGFAWFAIAAMITRNRIVEATGGEEVRTQTAWALDHWWLLALAPVAALIAAAVLIVWRGWQRAILTFTAALLIGLSLFQIHASWRMTYLEGDVPRDMLIYTQTAPDIPMLVEDLHTLSVHINGDASLPIYFGGESTWPMWWYLRDFTGKQFSNAPESSGSIPPDAAVFIVNRGRSDEARAELDTIFAGYTRVDYVLRWAFPETDTYRQFAIAPELDPARSAWGEAENPHDPVAVFESVMESIGHQLTPEGQQDLYRLIVYRDLTTPITSWATNISVYVRNDLLPVFNDIRY